MMGANARAWLMRQVHKHVGRCAVLVVTSAVALVMPTVARADYVPGACTGGAAGVICAPGTWTSQCTTMVDMENTGMTTHQCQLQKVLIASCSKQRKAQTALLTHP